VYRERIFSCDGVLKHELKAGLVIRCVKTLNQATVYGHYKKTNRYVTGTKAKPSDFRVT